MKKVFLLFILLVLSIFSTTNIFADDSKIKEINYRMNIHGGEGEYLKFELPDEVYRNARNINSFYITAYDDSTKGYVEVPYFTQTMQPTVVSRKEEYDTEFIEKVAVAKTNSISSIFRVTDRKGYAPIYNNIHFFLDQEHYDNILSISGSNDNINYESIATEPIFNNEKGQKDTVEFSEQISYEYLKFTWIGTKEDAIEPNIEGIIVVGEDSTMAYVPFVKDVDLDFTTVSNDTSTVVDVDIEPLRNRGATQVFFDIEEERFSRTVYAYTPTYTSAIFEKNNENEPTIFFKKFPTVFTIRNEEEEPLHFNKIVATVEYQYVIFENKYDEYVLNFNNYDNDIKAYDFPNMTDEIVLEDILKVKPYDFAILENDSEHGFKEENIEIILDTILVIIVSGLAFFGFVSFQKPRRRY